MTLAKLLRAGEGAQLPKGRPSNLTVVPLSSEVRSTGSRMSLRTELSALVFTERMNEWPELPPYSIC